MTVDPGGRRLWISLGTSAAAIAVVDIADPVRPRLVRTVRPPFLVHDVGFSPSGRRVYVPMRLAVAALSALFWTVYFTRVGAREPS